MFECGAINGEVVGKNPVRPLTVQIFIDSQNTAMFACVCVRACEGVRHERAVLACVLADVLFQRCVQTGRAVVMKNFALTKGCISTVN